MFNVDVYGLKYFSCMQWEAPKLLQNICRLQKRQDRLKFVITKMSLLFLNMKGLAHWLSSELKKFATSWDERYGKYWYLLQL